MCINRQMAKCSVVCSNAEILLGGKENELVTHSTNTSLKHGDMPRQPDTGA